jgi:23S rRNA (cytidine2498-2'-O)-methyltransferase
MGGRLIEFAGMESDEKKSGAMVVVCRREFEADIKEEVLARTGSAEIIETGNGMLVVNAGTAGLDKPLIFERQRIEDAVFIPGASLKSLARDVIKQLLPVITTSGAGWTCHVFAAEQPESLSVRAGNFEKLFLEFCKEKFGRVFRRYTDPRDVERKDRPLVLNICMAPEGVWGAVMVMDKLSDPRPGGIHRMAFDRDAPSRSYLKVEEALDLMGERPRPGETVIDLGASPGGWSYAFVKRGCRVTAVDNGPLRIKDPGRYGGTLVHLREDGVVYEPDQSRAPVDWLISDMLIPAGTNLGMLRKWFVNRWMKRFIVNIKLPQVHPYPVIVPVEDFLGTVRGVRFQIRQLYHDRREVTLFGWMDGKG